MLILGKPIISFTLAHRSSDTNALKSILTGKAASGGGRLVGKCHVRILINNGTIAKAYHASAFKLNNLQFAVLSVESVMVLTSLLRLLNGIFIIQTNRNSDDIRETVIKQGPFVMKLTEHDK